MSGIKVNLGSGKSGKIRWPDHIGIDKQDLGQEIVDDVLNIKKHFKKNSVTEFVSNMFLEHLTYEQAVQHLNDVWDLLVDGGRYIIEVPSVHRGKSYLLTHKSFWTKETFTEMENEEMCSECGLKPFKVVECLYNHKKNIYCTLEKVQDYITKRREGLE